MVNGVKNVLQRRLLGYFLLISLVPTFLFLGCYLYSTQRQMQRQMQNERRILLEHAAEKIGSRITQVNEFVSWTVRDETIRSLMYRSSEQAAIYDETSHAAAQILREQFSYRPITRYMLAFILMGDNGIDLRAGTEGYLIDEAQIRFAMEHEQKSPQWDGITRNLTTLTENTMVIPYYRHITNESTGQSLGDLLILFSPDLFADELTEILLLDDEHLVLYNEKGELLFSAGTEPASEEQTKLLSVDIPSTGWKLQQKPETALGQQIWTLISAGCLFVAVVAGFLVALSVFLSKNISLPIERLTAHIRRLSSGDFTHTVTMVRGSSEIDEVDRRLQDMGDDIQRLLHQQEEKQQIGNLIWENGKEIWIFSEKTGGSYSGTGDLFASVLCGGMVQGIGMEALVNKAVRFLGRAILDAVKEGTDRNDGVCFEKRRYRNKVCEKRKDVLSGSRRRCKTDEQMEMEKCLSQVLILEHIH